MIAILLVLIFLCVITGFFQASTTVRATYFKISMDLTAVGCLGFGGLKSDGGMRTLAILIIIMGLGFSFLHFVFPRKVKK